LSVGGCSQVECWMIGCWSGGLAINRGNSH